MDGFWEWFWAGKGFKTVCFYILLISWICVALERDSLKKENKRLKKEIDDLKKEN